MTISSGYREHRPHPTLADHVACYWTIRVSGAPAAGSDTVVPDGCLDFLFDLADGRSTLVGTMTRPLTVGRGGGMDLLGVRFRPGAISWFIDLPADEVTDAIVSLGHAWGPTTEALRERLRKQDDDDARVGLMDDALLRRLARHPGRGDRVVRQAAAILGQAQGRIRTEALADRVGLGRRQFERRFRAAVGVSPGTAGRVLRFQSARSRMQSDPQMALSWVALEAGYHDQAHFTREFRALAGETPGAYRKRLAPTQRSAVDDASVQDRAGPMV